MQASGPSPCGDPVGILARPFGPFHLRRLIFASYPRSGHHMTVNLLQAYWGESLHYCEPYREARQPTDNLIKTHDFELNEYYFSPRIVMVRDPLDSIASYFDQRLRTGVQEVDSYAEWFRFASASVAQWRHFYVKWVDLSQQPTYVVRYGDLLERPLEILPEILQFQLEGHTVDHARLEAAVAHVEPRVKGSYRTFRYYRPEDETLLNNVAFL